MRNFLVRKKASMHIHGKVNHVCVTEKVEFAIKQLLFIINLKIQKLKYDDELNQLGPRYKSSSMHFNQVICC